VTKYPTIFLKPRIRVHRMYEDFRCRVGLHRLKAWRAPERDDPNAIPMSARSHPRQNDYRKCDWCGAKWVGFYDGVDLYWRHTP
jgi:hypothetical protein